MADEIVEVTIAPDGAVEMHVEGVAGMACLTDTEDLVRLLGGDVESQELTADAYVDVEQEQQDRLWH
jgi:Protein of unknown function (DUF2997)